MIRGRRAHGAALATLPTCAHLSPDSQARLHRAGSVPCKPKTLKNECLRHIFPTARPPRVLPTPWALPTPAFATWQGAGKPPAPLPQSVVASNPKLLLRGCFASLDRFPAPSASVSFATPRRWRGVKGDEVVHFTLTPWNRPNTHRRGRWIGFATCPCGLASESGVWGKPQGLVFCF